ncbi:iron-sulfur cluster repair di-iron protein [Isachenkonia alkalipeptolytica]|uniref:Iron-sulfur cluster repair di-iron protein n=1 Tax=Isachenkonia alkalipeptolytica TaxID=2565777 RepID=A0AA44BDU3_9CLOT|nr:iron-sulfur cluster repair di-iron protein [Isachenkonia alkalipeptolytica]NBG88664.1 iron-sulfur cluster repair di-iron protein [Isachenkonia alkalipeptolytica]
MNNSKLEIKELDKNMSLGQVAGIYPGAINIFMDLEIDFCCGGNRPLGEALKEENHNVDEVLETIREKYRRDVKAGKTIEDFGRLSKGELMDHIIQTHHEYLRANLPRIQSLTDTIFRVHGENHYQMLHFVKESFNALKKELEAHLEKEETDLFPKMREYEQGRLDKAAMETTIQELEQEHDAAGDILKDLRRKTKGFTVPAGACNTFVFAFEKLEELEKDLFQHIHLENNMLFKL